MPCLCREGLLHAYNLNREAPAGTDYWRDVGTIDAYFEVNMDLLGPQPKLALHDRNWPIRGLGGQDGIVNRGMVEHSILSRNVHIGVGSHVEESILSEGARIGRGARVRRAIVEEGAEIPDGMEIGFDPCEDGKRFSISANGVIIVRRPSSQKPDSRPDLGKFRDTHVAIWSP